VSGAAIAARGVFKRFGRAAALRELDLDVAAGSTLAVLGPNGAGKSTLLRLLAGLSRPSAGAIRVDGRLPTHRSSRARVGYLGHATLLAPSLTVRENLVFAGRLYGLAAPRERAAQRLDQEGLEELAGRPVAALSRGQAQRVAIARALVHDPELVLLDEPFSGLDRLASARVAERLQALRARGATLVLVTHGQGPVLELADCALMLAAGRRAWSGPVDGASAGLERALELVSA
jgi:heme ABC exporter ATP-binding subunit CcmA